MNDPARKEAPSVGRRRFVLWLGGAGLLPVASSLGSFLGLSLGAGAAGAQAGGGGTGSAGATPTTPPATPPAGMAPAAGEEHKISDEARSLHSILMARYGKDLDDDQSKGLLEAIDGGVSSGQALRKRKLANSVEPATAFAASPLPASKPAAKGATADVTKGGR